MSSPASENIHTLLEFDKILDAVAGLALSPMAAEALRSLLPLSTSDEIRARLTEAAEMRSLLDAGESFPLGGLPDVRLELQQVRIPGRSVEPRSLVDLAYLCSSARRVRGFLYHHRAEYLLLFNIASPLMVLQDLEQAVEMAISTTDWTIKDSASPALARIRKEVLRAQEEARHRLRQILKSLADRDMLQEEVITQRDGRMVLMLKDEFRHRVPGLVHDESASGQTLFIEPMESVQMNNRIRQLQSAERDEIERILSALTERFRARLGQLEVNLDVLVRLDTIHAKARFAQRLNAAPPQITDEMRLQLIDARHPLLLLRGGDPQSVIPLDLELGGEVVTLIITGPNAGGKTVAMKTVGLLALMGLSGLPIPAAADSTIPAFQRIFADIGDRQSIENDLSTFTSHMARLVEIVSAAGPRDLVLIDEIGSGTDPEEGAALAVAILQELTPRRCLTLTTTHHGALKIFAHEQHGVSNGSMAFDSATLRPTYRFHAGIPGASYAFDIAGRLGLAPSTIQRAREIIGQEKISIEQLTADLERRLAEQKALVEKLKLEELRLAGLSKVYEERASRLKTDEARLRRQAVEDSAQLLQNANAAIERAIREIKEKEASSESIRDAKATLHQAQQQVGAEAAKVRLPPAEARPLSQQEIQDGMAVWWSAKNTVATLLERPDANGRVLLQMGNLKARVPLTEVQRLSNHQAKKAQSSSATSFASEPRDAVMPEIDLRGMRADEAVAAVDKFVDEAILAGWVELRIIHGKGTGALRKSIGDFLRTHPRVAAARPAPLGQGDFGVTLVTLA